jgi:hypothetical protein
MEGTEKSGKKVKYEERMITMRKEHKSDINKNRDIFV